MTETQRRIRAYKRALPGLRERVIAVALLLAMSTSMLASASFAWLTISRRPEVTGVSTTVAANGNLEIALATGNGKVAPGESQVGDSSALEGQSITAANITWGNLVNLRDPSYGLDQMTLRPAQLNTASLMESPLYGAVYSADGRITQLSSEFGYGSWVPATAEKPGYFAITDNYGVRAISSVHVEAVGAEAIYYNMVKAAENKNLSAANTYAGLGGNAKYMQSLATMMGLYMTARMNPDEASLNNPTLDIADVQNLRNMYESFLECFDLEADAMAALANLTLFLQHGEGAYTPYTRDMIYETTTAALKNQGIQVTSLDQFIKDRNIIASDLEKLKDICSSGQNLKWQDSGINQIVNNLVDVGKCTIGKDNTPISSIGASNAMGYLSGTQEARITNGILYRFEERTGGYIQVKNLGISATVKRMGMTIPATVKANIQTTAPREYNLFTNDLTYAESLNDGTYEGGIAVAQDTYGLAIDLWVRTNASNSYLTLEGNVLSESHEVRATGKDPDGNVVELFSVTRSQTDEEGNTLSDTIDLYKVETTVDGSTTTTWYEAESHSVFALEEGETPNPKMDTVVTVLGYEGENRIWDKDESLLSTDATTQGSGSCYVYYADTPEDQARSLKLLEAFNVAFVNDKGQLMGSAIMDTKNHYAQDGRVIVPLVLDPSSSTNLGEDLDGKTTYAITPLEQNVPTRITAIVYLNGTKLDNDDVLAASDIQGQLNIQFGSNASMEPIENEQLQNQILSVSAEVDKTTFDWDTATEPMTTNVTVHVDGSAPNTVEAFFLRKISDSQGSREDVMTFTKNANGDWVSSYTFTSPGNYVLRTVRLDGVDYDLKTAPAVQVKGFTVTSLSCGEANNNHITIMSAASSESVDMSLRFGSDDPNKMPKTVQGRFLRDDDGSAVNINFVYNATTHDWNGTATFLTSGEYTMQYLVLDGEYMELDSGMRLTASVTLGMRVAVYTTSPHDFKYLGDDMAENQKNLAMQVKIMDNADNPMPGKSNVKLTYNMKGSAVKKMDADLTWDGTYYSGTMANGGPGIWQFGNVEVDGDVLTYATTAPTFTIRSPEPPVYVGHVTNPYQYKPNNDAEMNVRITNSGTASVSALISNGTKETWVEGVSREEFTEGEKTGHNWAFVVPKDANGYQDGNWKLTKLKLWDVFAADGTAYTEEAPLEIDVSDTGNATKVVSRLYVTFPQGQSKDFGKDANGNVTATFMDSHSFNSLKVDIKDFENQPVTGISDVQLTFTYVNQSSGDYGGYSSSNLTNATQGATFTVALDSVNGTTYTQSKDGTILYAGSYATTFSFKVSGTKYMFAGSQDNASNGTKALPANAPVFTVWSKAPTATITAITPTGSNPAKITYTTKDLAWYQGGGTQPTFTATGNQTSQFNSSTNTATVYALADADNSTQRHGKFTQPTLTITVGGIPSDYTASLTLPAGSAGEVAFTRTGEGTIKGTLGKVSQYKSWTSNVVLTHTLQKYDGHGTQTIRTMTVTKGDMQYTVTLPIPLTITNPSSVNQ